MCKISAAFATKVLTLRIWRFEDGVEAERQGGARSHPAATSSARKSIEMAKQTYGSETSEGT